LAATHEEHRRRLLPRMAANNLVHQAFPPSLPPFAELRVVGILGEGGTGKAVLVRRRRVGASSSRAPSPQFEQEHTDRDDERSERVDESVGQGEEYALKYAADEHSLQWVMRERLALAVCHHPFVPRLFAASDSFLLMEVARGCELFYLLREVQRFEPSTVALYTAMTLAALVHLHGKRIAHRDIKPENLVLTSDGYVMLVDFGLSRQLGFGAERAWTLCGTPEYTAPEVIRGVGHGVEVDLWAIGVLLFELLAGYPPFCADDPVRVYASVLQASPSIPQTFTALPRDLISQLLRSEGHMRLGALSGAAVDVCCHEFFGHIDWPALLGRQVEAPLIPIVRDMRRDDAAAVAEIETELLHKRNIEQRRSTERSKELWLRTSRAS